MNNQLRNSFKQLKDVIEKAPLKTRFIGFDPFDGLNSPVIRKTILGKSKYFRLLWLQLFKRSPINLRTLVGINKRENPQALAIFLSSYCKLYQVDKKEDYLENINYLADRIIELKLDNWSGACWGYPFAWQARAFYQPEKTPLIIPTAYCFNALLDAFEITKNEKYKSIALSTADFILSDLNRSGEPESFAFSYSPFDKSVVYNASLMSSQVLARCYHYTSNNHYKNIAKWSSNYCATRQNENGSWNYGNYSFHQWIDSFHSGYNLVCLMDYSSYCKDKKFDSIISKGLEYYLQSFFEKNGFSKYYHNHKYPLDVNNTAQLIITLHKAQKIKIKKELITSVLNYTISNLQSKKGWFYYQKSSWITNRIIYLRWSNSWMFYTFSVLSNHDNS